MKNCASCGVAVTDMTGIAVELTPAVIEQVGSSELCCDCVEGRLGRYLSVMDMTEVDDIPDGLSPVNKMFIGVRDLLHETAKQYSEDMFSPKSGAELIERNLNRTSNGLPLSSDATYNVLQLVDADTTNTPKFEAIVLPLKKFPRKYGSYSTFIMVEIHIIEQRLQKFYGKQKIKK